MLPWTTATRSFLRPLWTSLFTRQQQPLFLQQSRNKGCFKTNKSAAKRFRVRGNGKLVRNHAGAQHNTGHKSRARCNRLRQSAGIKEPAIEKRMRRLIGR